MPAAQAKPFDFAVEYDAATRKLQITVKKAGSDFVFAWADPVLVANMEKMKGVEGDIGGWKEKVEEAIRSAGKLHGGAEQISKWVESVAKTAAAGEADAEVHKEVEAIDAALGKLENEKAALNTKTGQFWNSGPNGGVAGLLKKHGISEQIVEERKQADADYQVLQRTLATYQDGIRRFEEEIASARKQNKETGVKLASVSVNLTANRQEETEDAAMEIQKTIGEIQGYTNADFEEVNAKALTKEAGEFASKSGAAWARLSANPGEIDKALAAIRDAGLKMRVRSGRVVERFGVWQKPLYLNRKALEKYQSMLKMVRKGDRVHAAYQELHAEDDAGLFGRIDEV